MKQILLLTCIVCPFFLTAQTVSHFENESSKWFVADTYPNANQQNPSFVQTATTVYGFLGDTTVQGEQWFKTYSSPDPTFSSNLTYQGLLREEGGYVFFQDTTSSIDTLYNFNLEEGDSVLYVFYDTYPEYLEVVSVDSVNINGQMFKRMRLSEPTVIQAFTELDETWIEGIGSLHGPLFTKQEEVFSDGEMPDSLKLVCSHMDEILYWQNEFYDQCLVNIILSSTDIQTTDFDVYPNPTTDRFFVRQQQGTGQFLIRDILGQQVLSGQLQSDDQSVDINNLKSGIYFVTVILDNTSLTKEIIKY